MTHNKLPLGLLGSAIAEQIAELRETCESLTSDNAALRAKLAAAEKRNKELESEISDRADTEASLTQWVVDAIHQRDEAVCLYDAAEERCEELRGALSERELDLVNQQRTFLRPEDVALHREWKASGKVQETTRPDF